jgi:hypothetical protein
MLFPNWNELLPHQIEVIRSPQRFKVLVWHRRARKTTTALVEMIKQSQLTVGGYWHLFPTYAEAKDAVWRNPAMLFRVIPEDWVKSVNQQELVVYLKNGSYIQLKGADDPDALRGAAPMGIIFDEFAMQKLEAWKVMEPVLRENGGWAWFVTTPKGKNHAFEFFEKGLQGNPEWKSWILKASTSGIIDPYQLEEMRKGMSESFYNQELECEFLEGEGSVFRGVKEIMTASPKQPQPGHLYVIGADLARLRDFTVLTVYDRGTNAQVYQDRFQELDWEFQRKKVAALSAHYNNALVEIDATGIGDPIFNDLQRAGVPIEPFKITETTKKELIEKMSIWIEQRGFTMIPIEETKKEFEQFTYKLGETGKVHYGAPQGENYHDDIVISHALAVWNLNPVYAQVEEKEPTLIQQALRRAINANRDDDNEGYF